MKSNIEEPGEGFRATIPEPAPKVETGLIPLNDEQEQTIKQWAADDRLWTTQETVEFNLRTFARCILKPYVCNHQNTYYSNEHDNFYCKKCHQGMGQEYYTKHMATRRTKGVR